MFSLDALISVLPKAGLGWLGVFVVMLLIAGSVEILEYLTGRKK